MQIDIRARRLALSPAMRQRVARRLEQVLGAHRLWVQRVEVCLEGASRRHGETACSLVVRLVRLPAITARDLGADLYGAVDRAAAQVHAALGGRLGQRRRTKRLFGVGAVRGPVTA